MFSGDFELMQGWEVPLASSGSEEMFSLAKRLWPICRSITGDGVRETLKIIKEKLPQLQIHEVPSGTKCFDWEVPDEWNIRDAYVIDPDGQKIIDFKKNNLHVVSYSEPVDKELKLEELDVHLNSIPESPNAIPYITSYYKRTWGFCLSHEQRSKLKKGLYKVRIDSEIKKGSLTYGELILPGKEESEIFLSTYVCHPSLANNELSGPVVVTALAQWLQSLPERRHTYRIFFGPETIGAIVYISRHLQHLKENVIAGHIVTCVGDEKNDSFLPSRWGNTYPDVVSKYVLEQTKKNFKSYSYLTRGSDERQYCSPGVDLPFVSIMRSKYGHYPEYHTSLDDLSFITPAGLNDSLATLKNCMNVYENNYFYNSVFPCEPQLGRRGLYAQISAKREDFTPLYDMSNLLGYCDGKLDLLEISKIIGADFPKLVHLAQVLEKAGVIQKIKNPRILKQQL